MRVCIRQSWFAPVLGAMALLASFGMAACGGGSSDEPDDGADGGAVPTAPAGKIEGELKSTGALDGTWSYVAPAKAGCSTLPLKFEAALSDGGGKVLDVEFNEDGTWEAKGAGLAAELKGTGAKLSASQLGTALSLTVEIDGEATGGSQPLKMSGTLKVRCD